MPAPESERETERERETEKEGRREGEATCARDGPRNRAARATRSVAVPAAHRSGAAEEPLA